MRAAPLLAVREYYETAAKNAPGKHYRKGLSLMRLAEEFPTDDAAREWFENECWPDWRTGQADLTSRMSADYGCGSWAVRRSSGNAARVKRARVGHAPCASDVS